VSKLSKVLVVLMMGFAACGSPEKQLCEKTAECDPDIDVDACLAEYDDYYQEVEELGCEDSYNDTLKCLAKNGECSEDGLVESTECDADALVFFACALGGATLGTTSN
jgi:hypothetical protein